MILCADTFNDYFHPEVAIAATEALEASEHELILSDGFSCRSQIEHGSERSALHLAQVVQMAMRDGPNGPPEPRPEARYHEQPGPPAHSALTRAALAVGAAGAVGALAAAVARGRR